MMDTIERASGIQMLPKSLFETIFNQSTSPCHVESQSGEILLINEALATALGVSTSQATGMLVEELWKDSELLQKRRNAISASSKLKQPVAVGEEHFVMVNGDALWLMTKVIPVDWPGSEDPAFIISSEDITLSKQLDEAHKNFDKKVKERTSELLESQDKLVRQERLSVLGRIAGNIAHEIRNPLSAIHQSLFLLHLELDEEGLTSRMPIVQEQLEIIENELNLSNGVITRMLESTRVRKKIMSRVDLGEAIQQAEDQIWVGKEGKLLIDIEPEPFYLWGDPVNFRQVFANLLDNCKTAIMGVSNPEVLIRARYNFDKTQGIIEIQDNGCGIPEDIQEMVWEALFTTSETGTGLGLCICQEIIEEKYGGEMTFSTEVGKGTTFKMVLPVDEQAFQEEDNHIDD